MSSLQYNDIVAAQTVNPPTYGEQGQITNADTSNNIPVSTPALPTSNVITPESMAPGTVAGFTQPTPTVTPDTSNLYTTPPATLTPEQTMAQTVSDRLQTLNDQLVGKSADQTAENTKFGVDAAQKTITDLTSQLTGIQNDAKAIPLLLQNSPSSQGISSDIISGQQTKLLNDNAVKALTVSTLLSAAQGQLANAQSLADKAVAAKYDPIQEEITSATNNLNLILNSPEYSVEQKNQAQTQLDAQNEKQATLNQQKSDTAAVLQIATTAAANGADAPTLKNISEATTPEQALQIAATAGVAISGKTQGTLFDVPTATQLGGAQFYKYPTSSQVYTSKGTAISLAQFKQLTGQQNVPDAQVNFGGIKTINPTGTTTPTTKPTTLAQDVTSMTSQLSSVKGSDGYVSPQDWKTALAAWQKAGRSAANFKTNFQNFINPADKQDYN